MTRTAVLFVTGLAALLLSGPAVAKDQTESRGAQTAPAEKPSKLAMPHHAEGSVVSVDKSANTVVIKDTKGEQLNLVADSETAAQLNRLKAGDQVKVTYKKSKDQMVATKINLTGSSRAK
jgi:invasion protein IalB